MPKRGWKCEWQIRICIIWALIFVVSQSASSALVPILDINKGPAFASTLGQLYPVGGQIFYGSSNQSYGLELWRTDGTPEGSRMVKDLAPGPDSGFIALLGQSNGILLFSGVGGLWRSDGTEEGTFLLSSIKVRNAISLNGLMWFDGQDTSVFGNPTEPWRSDGTIEGTYSITAQFQSGILPRSSVDTTVFNWGNPLPIGYQFSKTSAGVYFINGSNGLWKTGGTAATTFKVGEIPGGVGGFQTFGSGGDWLSLMSSGPASDLRWWAFDGTSGQFVELQRSTTWTSFAIRATLGNSTLAVIQTPSIWELWKSDGTAAGTIRLKQFDPDYAYKMPRNFHVADGRVYFSAGTKKEGEEPWVSDGTPKGTFLLKNIGSKQLSSSPSSFIHVGRTVYFFTKNPTALWSTDGTSRKTVENKVFPNYSFQESSALAYGDGFYYHVGAGWIARQTAGASAPVYLAPPGSGSGAGSAPFGYDEPGKSPLFPDSPFFLFTGYDGTSTNLWRSDGTQSGTSPFLAPKPGGSPPTSLLSVVSTGKSVCFTQTDKSTVQYFLSVGGAAPKLLSSLNCKYADYNGQRLIRSGTWIFTFRGNSRRRELWCIDGLSGAVSKCVAEGKPPDLRYFSEIESVGGGVIYFRTGNSYWRASAVDKSLRQMPYPRGYWTAFFGGIPYEARTLSDGSVAIVKRSVSSESSEEILRIPRLYLRQFFFANGYLWIIGSNSATTAEEQVIWRSDGTPAGSLKSAVFTTRYPETVSFVGGMASGILFFTVKTSSGMSELWTSDGTPGGTCVIHQGLLNRSRLSLSDGFSTVMVGGRVYFAANDGIHGEELWQSDGTLDGTSLLMDITEGPGSSNPSDFQVVGKRLYFCAFNPETGREAYFLDLPPDQESALLRLTPTLPSNAADPSTNREMLLRRAFNLSPDQPLTTLIAGANGVSGLPAFTRSTSDGADCFRVEYLRSRSATWTYFPKWSTTLEAGSWQPMSGKETIEDLGGDWQRVILEQTINPVTTPRLFGIVEVHEN